jgi:predicted polyphosphate/ATP-dependent NAD kinase
MKINTVAFFVNPLAGYGGVRNNKGSDNLHLENIKDSVSIKRAVQFLDGINTHGIDFTVPYGPMGSLEMDEARIGYKVSYYPESPTTSTDTINFVRSASGADIICFVGGDGTARDILSAGSNLPVLGIPSGVKMYSSVFSMNIRHAIDVFNEACYGNINYTPAEVADINEEEYRAGTLDIKKFGTLRIPDSDGMVRFSKAEYPASSAYDIAEYIIDNMKDDVYYIIGPGNTCKAIVASLGFRTNMLGFDIFKGKELIASDTGEDLIYNFTERGQTKIIISIIGGQGFLLGRGNQQLSHRVIEKAGFKNICVVSSPEKLSGTRSLAIDLDSHNIDIPKFVRVLTGYGQFRIIRTDY